MIISLSPNTSNSMTNLVVLNDLIKQFGVGQLTYDELWVAIFAAFPACRKQCHS